MSKADMLAGKVVVVTGAGGGIGRDIALAMAREGARVVVNDIGASVTGEGVDAGPTQAVVNEIRAAGGEAVASTDSVSQALSAQHIISAALGSFGRIDCVVNNAGILRDRFFHKMGDDEWDAVIKVHLYGAYHVSRAAAPHFKAQESGNYIHMTSTSGLIGNFGQANYSAAKLGVVALSKSIALDMLKFNVRSNCIAPFAWSRMIGAIPTDTPAESGPGRSHQADDAGQDRAAGCLPGQRSGTRCQWSDFCGAQQRNFPDQPAAPDPLGTPFRRLDSAGRGQPRAARAESQLLCAGLLRRRV